MPVVADLGSFAPTATVTLKVATLNLFGGLEWWGGLALLVRPDGSAAEDGISYGLDTPVDGKHTVTIDLPAAAAVGGDLAPGRYRVALYGDEIPKGELVQGTVVAAFDVTGAA